MLLPLSPSGQPGLLRRVFFPLGLALVASGLPAATEVVEMKTDLHGAVGKLKDEVVRQEAPVIEAASDEAKQALARMKLPPGIVASLWAAEPMFANPVAFNFDEKGRAFVAETFRYHTSVLDIRDYMWMLEDDLACRNQTDFLASIRRNFGDVGVKELSKESERVTLLEDTNGDGVADKSTIYADNFRSPIDGIASGVLARHGEVWFTNIPSLWKFTGQNKAETRTELLRGFGIRFNYTGHDFHGLIFGPDGRIYFTIGDRGASVKNREGAMIESPDAGCVFRCYPDGSQLELFASGLRNPQSLLFNEYGDLFTGDNDCDQGDQERLVHVVENGDSGWRIGYQFAPRGNAGPWNAERLWLPRHPSQPTYLLAPICNIEDGPSGVAYYPGTGLSPDYVGRIFITHFKGAISSSGIYTYKLKPAGASYAIEDSAPFLRNALPTDIRFGPDGRLYYSDWAEGWAKSKRGRIYAMFDPNHVNDPLVKSTQQLIASDYTKKTAADLAGLLAHPDWRVRLEAQYTLADRGEGSLALLAGVASDANGSPLARRHAVWALGQLGARFPAAIAALRPLLKSADDEIRAQAIKLLGDFRDQASADVIVAALSDSAARVKFFAAQSLGRLRPAAATPALVAAVRANHDADAYLRHALVMGLVGCATPTELGALKTDESRSVRLAAVLALRRLASPEVAAFLTDADPLVLREAAEAINDAPVTAAYPALATLVERPVDSEPVMLRALNAHFRLGTAVDAEALAGYVVRPEAPEALREEALTLLSLWPNPPARDRLVGVFRPLADQTRDGTVVAKALRPHLDRLLTGTTPDALRIATLGVVTALKMTEDLPLVRTVVASETAPEAVRSAALASLDHLSDPLLADSVAVALASKSAALHLAALPLSTRLHPETATGTLSRLLDQGTLAEQRAAYTTLGGLDRPEADTMLVDQLKKLSAGQIIRSAQVELLEAAALRSAPIVKQALADREAALAKESDTLAAYRVSIEGGNAEEGRDLFYYHPVLACVRCHKAEPEGGGDAGPVLAGIGAIQTREYVLESIVKPNAKIAAGFDNQVITRKSGALVAGVFVSEDDQQVTLRDSDGKSVVVKKAEIATRASAPSSMPEVFGAILTKHQLRDLVEFIHSLKAKMPKKESPPRALTPAPTD